MPFRFVIYFFILGILLATGVAIAIHEGRTDKYNVETIYGENISIEEIIEKVQIIKNFSIPPPVFSNIVGVDIIIDYGDYIGYSNRTYHVNNRVEGISMLPIIYENSSLLCVKDFTKEELQINSIIVFVRSGGYVSHRIIDIQNGSYITQGDNNIINDGYVEYEDVHCLIGGIIYGT